MQPAHVRSFLRVLHSPRKSTAIAGKIKRFISTPDSPPDAACPLLLHLLEIRRRENQKGSAVLLAGESSARKEAHYVRDHSAEEGEERREVLAV